MRTTGVALLAIVLATTGTTQMAAQKGKPTPTVTGGPSDAVFADLDGLTESAATDTRLPFVEREIPARSRATAEGRSLIPQLTSRTRVWGRSARESAMTPRALTRSGPSRANAKPILRSDRGVTAPPDSGFRGIYQCRTLR